MGQGEELHQTLSLFQVSAEAIQDRQYLYITLFNTEEELPSSGEYEEKQRVAILKLFLVILERRIEDHINRVKKNDFVKFA